MKRLFSSERIRGFFSLNPVTLKEMRQMVRSRTVSWGLVAYLFGQLLVVFIAVSNAMGSSSAETMGMAGYGGKALAAACWFLSLQLYVVIPAFIAMRAVRETDRERMDLQFTTALKPTQFVDGKIASAFLLMLLFVCATLPYLVLSYLLRGIDLFEILARLGWLLLGALCFDYLVLFVGVSKMSKILRNVVLMILLLQALFLPTVVTQIFSLSSRHGASGIPGWGVALIVAGAATFCLLARATSASLLAPPHIDRDRPLHVLVCVLWLFWGAVVVAFGMPTYTAAGEPVIQTDNIAKAATVWSVVSALLAALLIALAATRAPGLSHRVRAGAPRGLPRRLLAFPFATGAEPNFVFGMLLAAVAATTLWCLFTADKDVLAVAVFVTALAGYAVTVFGGVHLVWDAWNARFARKLDYKYAAAAALLVLGLIAAVPAILAVMTNGENDGKYVAGNIVALLAHNDDEMLQVYHLGWSAIGASLVIALSAPAIIRAFKSFKTNNDQLTSNNS